MKLTFISYIILIILFSVDCVPLKHLLENVKQDIHSVVDGAVNIIGKRTHKISEGLGVFLHRNEGHKFSDPVTETPASSNHISNDEKPNNTHNKEVIPNTHEGNTDGNESHAQNYNNLQSTPASAFIEHTSKITDTPKSGNSHNNEHEVPTTEVNTTKNVKQYEANEDIHNETVAPTTATHTGITTKSLWFNGAELDNILPSITHNETHFTGNTNELGTGENQPTMNDIKNSNKAAKCDENQKPTDQSSDKNLVSDQMFFNDNKPKANETNSSVCAKGLVRAANGDCLKQTEIDVRKKDAPMVANVFEADACVSGYARALDGSCQKIIG